MRLTRCLLRYRGLLCLICQGTILTKTRNGGGQKKKKNKLSCVGRESNPGQLLGRQLCSPLYHRRLAEHILVVTVRTNCAVVAAWATLICQPHWQTPWRNGSASDSRSEGCVFESRRGQNILCIFQQTPQKLLPACRDQDSNLGYCGHNAGS